jgi:aryl-alcohol dehydrogenase-like predicted oxidoreductase
VERGRIALAWLVTYYGEAVVAIPGASRPEQRAEAAAIDVYLSGAEIDRIDRISATTARR